MAVSLEARDISDELAAMEVSRDADDETKKSLWLKLAAQLEIDGVEKAKISTRAAKMIEERMRERTANTRARFYSRWFFVVMSEAGYVNPTKQTRMEAGAQAHQENSSIPQGNKRLIQGIRRLRDVCAGLEKAATNLTGPDGRPFNTESSMDGKTLDGFVHDIEAVARATKDAGDAKTVVPTNMHGMFKELIRTEAGMLKAGKLFVKARMEMLVKLEANFLTNKQGQKFTTGHEPNQLPIFQPKDRSEAIFALWYGLACENCKKWRVEDAGSYLKCIDCGHQFKGYTVTSCRECGYLFYKDDLLDVIATGQCPECQAEVPPLPESLKAYARKSKT